MHEHLSYRVYFKDGTYRDTDPGLRPTWTDDTVAVLALDWLTQGGDAYQAIKGDLSV